MAKGRIVTSNGTYRKATGRVTFAVPPHHNEVEQKRFIGEIKNQGIALKQNLAAKAGIEGAKKLILARYKKDKK